jgi:hypothetical protein
MNIPLWLLLAIVCTAGAVGGLVNGLISDNGFLLPCMQQVDHLRIVRPGFLGNTLIGMVAAGLSWGLYGPLSTAPIFGVLPATQGLTLSALLGAALVGIGGARWVTNEIDKKLLTVAASKAAAAPPAPEAAQQIVAASPAQALAIAQQLSV